MSVYRTGLMLVGQYQIGSTAGAAKSSSMRKKWAYSTDDAAATVETSGYFNTLYDLIGKGDVIEAVMEATGTTPVVKTYVVTASSSSGVTIALATATSG